MMTLCVASGSLIITDYQLYVYNAQNCVFVHHIIDQML